MTIVKSFYSIEKKIQRINSHYLRILLIVLNSACLNLWYTVYNKLFGYNNNKQIQREKYVDLETLVSLTTYPQRMNKLPLVLESIFRQTVKVDRVILWLAENQYDDKQKLYRIFQKYIKLGLEIKFCDDLKPHKKYYYSILENPEAIVITLDDDIIYPEDLVEKLLLCYKDNPNCIVAQRAHWMTYDSNNNLNPYSLWEMLAPGRKGPSMNLFATTGGGCLFPPHILPQEAFNKEAIHSYCINADDVWIKCMSYYNNVKVVLTDKDNPEIIEIMSLHKDGLAKQNVVNNMNDHQLRAVSDYYGIKWEPEA